MSKKTMKQRIALVAVSALTAGVFSVVSTPVANSAAAANGAFTLATENSLTGVAVQGAIGDIANARSLGVLNVVGTKDAAVASLPTSLTAGASTTGTILNTAVVAVQISSATRAAITVTGGTLSSATATSAIAGFNGSNTAIATGTDGDKLHILVTPNAGVTSMTISGYTGAALVAATATTGTLAGTYVLTVATTALTGSFSATDSAVAVTTTAATAAITTSVDASTSGILAGNPLFIQVVGKNAYGQALASGTYVATATNGATIAWGGVAVGGNGAATAAGTLSVATLTASGDGADQVRIDPASSLTTTTTTVTITHNGTPVTTKTLTFYGEAKKIVIESVKSGRTGTTVAASDATAYAVYSYRDSADGKVPGGAAGFAALSATSIISTGASVRSPSRSTQATLVGTNSALGDATETAIGTGTDGVFAFSCGSTSGTSTVVIAAANTISLATLTANVTIACNGGFATYTVSTDKASYAVGEIATITIDAKDSSGNAVSENTALPVASVSVGGGALTAAIAGTELFTAGKRTVQAQMTTAGTFNLVVTIAGSVTSTATARYAITDGAVSNAAVLQSIVALIASINKQIAALQKLILARR